MREITPRDVAAGGNAPRAAPDADPLRPAPDSSAPEPTAPEPTGPEHPAPAPAVTGTAGPARAGTGTDGGGEDGGDADGGRDAAARGSRPGASARRLVRALGLGGTGRRAQQHSRIEVGNDWRRCGAGDGGCGVLLPLGQQTCPRCGRTNRDDLAPLDLRRRLATRDGQLPALAAPRGRHRPPG
ncbi:hypothetical protein CC117_12430 [Parafrankia colletiae]|uniref:Uncharacterized protein n=1 Tax=Parafrankia colletiae TaxID=573497 RepID=A0A1S1R9A2_9ACTN|nr:hypothetical protein [Parafrankia colletiae]MCK9900117.1 hypothetical protein [Frankia sp. Cpl3]OHV42361.1 hypothetical protein CC117_12430 [Parafrankia colletiae]